MKKILFSAFIFISLLWACKKQQQPTPENNSQDLNSTPVKTAKIESGKESETISALGIVMSESDAKPSFKTGGIIDRTFVKEGDAVKKGQLLATLIMTEINAQVKIAEEALEKSERDLKRVKNLYTDSVATLEQFQNASTVLEMARRSVEIARFNRGQSEVRSPIAGRIVKQILHPGELAGPGIPVYAIMGTQNQDWTVRVGLTDRDWARVNIGDPAEISLDAYPEKKFTAVVDDKAPVGGEASGTLDVILKIKNLNISLAAGLVAKSIIYPKSVSTYTTIPIEAMVEMNQQSAYVFVIEEGRAKKIMLKIIRLMGDKVAIHAETSLPEEVITTGSSYLEEGDLVRKVN